MRTCPSSLSVETVKTQVKRALKTLRQLLGSYWIVIILEMKLLC